MDSKDVEMIFDARFIRVADLKYAPGKHYFDATRRTAEDLVATKSEEEFRNMLPDAVTCYVVIVTPGEGERLLLTYEYRYPTGRFMLSPPAGLIDPSDSEKEDAVLSAASREIKEETGIEICDGDRLFTVSPLVFSSPGFTDENNALVGAVIERADLSELDQSGAVGSELFDGFELLTKEQALDTLKRGTDRRGHYYPMYTWGALVWFVSDMWK